MQPVADHIDRFVPFFSALSTVTIEVAVNTYLFPFDMQGGQGVLTVICQLGGVDSVQNLVAKKPGLEKMVQDIHQKVYLLNKGERASELAEL